MIGARIIFAIGVTCVLTTNLPAQNKIELAQFDQWIFQDSGNEAEAMKSLDAKIELEIARIEQTIKLSESHIVRVRLAARGDIKHFMDRVDVARMEFLELAEQLDQQNLNEAYQLALPLQQELSAGLFIKGSLLSKVIKSGLDPSQTELLKQEFERREKLRTIATIRNYIAKLGRSISLTQKQRQRMLDLAIANVKTIPVDGRYSQYLVAYRISQLPEKEIEPIFDEQQWKGVQQTLRQANAYGAMLRAQGLLDDE